MSRTTHDRVLDHHGTVPVSVVMLGEDLARYAAGITLDAVLDDLDSRLAAAEALLGVFYLTAGAILQRERSGSFAMDLVIRVGLTGSATADAVIA